ncbi:recombination-associated protein RdgC [Geomobilimonas luticola]|uniref:Recombination-associated protein RdgC n=1 Tax=Geomobilimonas luticola TaxID=1114878 RepID=A0ABS5SDH7_9BACT|nr:recombination-associated protein RdgC [Geomobilimonas luticola]MBT0653419.1 recombination-associated protein RdgC [Geomobilimonas luticola]
MGILSNTVSICQFRVAGDIPSGDLFTWASERLARQGFQSIEGSSAELSVGWVHLDDNRESDFAVPAAFWRDHYLTFTLRRDQRKLPAVLLKAYLQVAEHEHLAANPGLSRVPKQKREELREAVRAALLSRTLPVPTSWDAVWDTRTGLVTFTALSPAIIELFEAQFKKTFEGLRLVAVHPYARGTEVVSDDLLSALEKANQATSEAVLDLIRSNRWLGTDFLLWLLYRTMEESSEYRVRRPGPAGENDPFVAYLNDRLVLQNAGENGVQKITVAGPQDHFSEVRTALRNGKVITEATLYLEREEHVWRLTLKGEMFQFASLKGPAVQIEKDNTVDGASEREAVFFERMHILEEGLQLFDSLYATFLADRLSQGWGSESARIQEWLAGE